ncbi:mesocentin [Sitophilus oryzae]|uniref:Mesocentin n=1 Tax=Sitophilus oryzae TaxID=7048 RepID=A0A6J2Y2J6_SITOR|nr:mesocentin [Sitophilus oryzae]
MKFFQQCKIWILFFMATYVYGADDDYNILHKDGSFQFGYNNPDSYHYADGNRNNVVKGEFGGRNPKTGGIDTTVYTAGPRGFRPRGKNVYRNYDLNQNGPRPVGSRDDPYYDPYEDPSYKFGFRTRTYSRQENANRVGDVTGRYTYLDDVGERHNVEYIAGKNTGFHVKNPFPDSNPRAYGPLFFRGRGKPIPRGRTSIQRGLDGSYKFVSAGPDQRRTEVSDSTGHIRGSYTYLDDKGVQHSVHYIAGPETGYRVLKTVKGPHLPTVYPFDRPDIISPDFYDYLSDNGEVFDTAASGRPVKPGRRPLRPNDDIGNKIDTSKNDRYQPDGGGLSLEDTGSTTDNLGFTRPTVKPTIFPGSSTTPRPAFNSNEITSKDETSFDFGDLFNNYDGSTTTIRPGGIPSRRPAGRPFNRPTTTKPTKKPFSTVDEDDGFYRPNGDNGSYKPEYGSSSSLGTGSSTTTGPEFEGYPSGRPSTPGLFEGESGRPFGNKVSSNDYDGTSGLDSFSGVIGVGGKPTCPKCAGTIVTNIGDRPFNIPPGVSVRTHVQSIDLYPYDTQSPSEAYESDTKLQREQLNAASSTDREIKKESAQERKLEVEETEENVTKESNKEETTTV